MATDQEKTELVEALKGPHFYKITVNGYGGETVFATIAEEAHNFWKEITEEHGDGDLVAYCVGAEDCTPEQLASGEADIDFSDIDATDIPREAMFLHDEDGEVGRPWFECHTEVFHNYGAWQESARMYIEKVDAMGWEGKHLEDIVDGEDISEFVERVGESTEWAVEPQVSLSETVDWQGEPRQWEHMDKGDFVFQFHSSEKGCFFEGYIETDTLFDEKKLQVIVDENAAGEDMVWGFQYDGKEVDNDGGGDTNGKGYYAWVWKQEH